MEIAPVALMSQACQCLRSETWMLSRTEISQGFTRYQILLAARSEIIKQGLVAQGHSDLNMMFLSLLHAPLCCECMACIGAD